MVGRQGVEMHVQDGERFLSGSTGERDAPAEPLRNGESFWEAAPNGTDS